VLQTLYLEYKTARHQGAAPRHVPVGE